MIQGVRWQKFGISNNESRNVMICINFMFDFTPRNSPSILLYQFAFFNPKGFSEIIKHRRFKFGVLHTGAAKPQKKCLGLGGYYFLVYVFITFLGDLEK